MVLWPGYSVGMVDDQLRYDRMVETALRDVVRQALRKVAESGLPGDHHFYLTFLTAAPGVDIPGHLAEQYPDEMTIVLQHQFDDLEVSDDAVAVTLSFNNTMERLTIPFAAVSTFADPSVNFALQFQPATESEQQPAAAEPEPEPEEEPAPVAAEAGGKIVALDQFRKK